jgi:hypothetical protein
MRVIQKHFQEENPAQPRAPYIHRASQVHSRSLGLVTESKIQSKPEHRAQALLLDTIHIVSIVDGSRRG